MAKSSSNGDTPKRFELQIPDFKRDPKTNWSWANDKGLSNLNLKFESGNGESKPQEGKPKIDY